MVATRQLTPKKGDVLVLVGTTKGLFALRSNGARGRWERGGPHFPGQQVYAAALDSRAGTPRLFAGGGMPHWGPLYHWSDDFGRTWVKPEQNPVRFPEDTGESLVRIWQIQPGRASDPDTFYCGVEPSALFVSRDRGETWSLVRGLWNHPHREQWQPGGGGKCLHTILPDPVNARRLTVAMSTGGVYRSDDGGATWTPKNKGVRAEYLPDKHPEFGQCVHKVVHHPTNPARMFLQNHWGLYRTDDAGESWRDIAKGVPSDFGFCMAMHPHDPDTVYIVPIESDEFRATPEGRLRVYRTRNGGTSWEAMTRGLPQQNTLEMVLRDAMDVDPLNPAGVYFGTRNGVVWGSRDGGTSWSAIAMGLPPVLCVRADVVGGAVRRAPKGARGSASKAAAARPRPARGRSARAPAKRSRPSRVTTKRRRSR